MQMFLPKKALGGHQVCELPSSLWPERPEIAIFHLPKSTVQW